MRQNSAEMEQNMKAVDYKKPINTIPEGVWESSRPEGKSGQDRQNSPAIDLQGNGYPAPTQKNLLSSDKKQDAASGKPV